MSIEVQSLTLWVLGPSRRATERFERWTGISRLKKKTLFWTIAPSCRLPTDQLGIDRQHITELARLMNLGIEATKLRKLKHTGQAYLNLL